MVEVSEKFRQLAQDNGRRVWCRIVADGVEFQDDALIEMSFDDVVHPDWFTIGTTCANRLHFPPDTPVNCPLGRRSLPSSALTARSGVRWECSI